MSLVIAHFFEPKIVLPFPKTLGTQERVEVLVPVGEFLNFNDPRHRPPIMLAPLGRRPPDPQLVVANLLPPALAPHGRSANLAGPHLVYPQNPARLQSLHLLFHGGNIGRGL